jgi:hypothetical protein
MLTATAKPYVPDREAVNLRKTLTRFKLGEDTTRTSRLARFGCLFHATEY